MNDHHFITPETGMYAMTGNPATLRVLSDLELKPEGKFFNFVLTYLIASAGLTPVYDSKNYPNFMQATAGIFPGKIDGDVKADLSEAVGYVRSGRLPQSGAEELLCCMLANTAYESIGEDDKCRLVGTPVFEVFHHVRNAAAHANSWHFHSKSPKYPGEWRGLKVDNTVKGDQNPLHGKKCFYGDLQPADLLHLLRDVERLIDGR
jgi:hypothetical protein